MKIILIRQAQTDFPWEKEYDSVGFERALEAERCCAAVPYGGRRSEAAAYRVYTGTAPAAAETAEMLFELTEPPIRTPLLDDVPLRAFRDTDKRHPLRLWENMGRLQWAAGSARQPESRAATLRRVGEFVDLLEAEERDCVVVCRGLTMSALKSTLRGRGFLLEGGELRPQPLERIRATKKSLHCGGCHHNCLLTEAKCQIGQNKAKGGK